MEPRVIQIGNYRESEDRKFDNPQCGRVYSVDGLSPTINTCQGGDREPKILLEMEEKEIKGVSVHPLSHKLEFDGNVNEEISPCLRATDYKAPHCVWEEEKRYKAKRIQALVDSGKIDPEKVQFLDCYNQSVSDDVTGTISTRIDGANHYFVSEPKSCASRKRGDEHKIETRNDEVANCVTSIDTDSMVQEPLKIPQATKQGYIECPVGGVFDAIYPNSESRRGRVQDNGEVSPALTSKSENAILRYEGVEPQIIQKIGDRGTDNYSVKAISNTIPANPMSDRGQLLVEPQVLTPLRTEEGRQLRKQGIEKFSNRALYPREDGVSNTITSVQKDNLLQEPKIVGYTRDSKGNIVNHHFQDTANTIHTCTGSGRNTDQYVAEAAQELKEIAQSGRNCNVDVTINEDGSLRPYNKNTKAKDGISEFVTQHEDNSANTVTTSHGGNVYGKATRYRIRKLTEREVFRLMDVSEEDIDKILSSGISKTAAYRLAGNSICCGVLYHIFRKMFIESNCEEQQLSLF